ncbi:MULTISPECIES: hypothetical protein [unclassified Pseudomonas]|jgi:hypothetical protein|uniref:hypothetical protein n=1 Tax=unclassified Pseudomonas TaxID=196821 RepID=UPI000C878031|nr:MULTISPECIES: hypothetical protein [unclassified Pseudomonas]PMU11867.1 hypothetical protein C1Y11_04860 [Pseudomonas sp. FW305-20]PMU19989.1 hypothetical protein C1Y10_07695 [Pseudomonas sp. FW305-122]PMU43087.1 hypothetical protein C1Y12_02660 [Pseudomonas sp. FW305-47B]PMX64414.1 hypothetical protein C1Y13_03460 [Pseudomonas sp. FW305-33]PMX68830.1 hypothetical protein C1X12_10365 [Pseudomonas sp. FW305-60]
MAGADGDNQIGPFGRIKLDGIYSDWASGHHLNPRLLASELAATLETLAPLNQPIQPLHASVFSEGRSDRNIQITHGALADYFTAASTGRAVTTISTSSGPIPATNILIWRKWIERLVDEATTRSELAAGFAQPANDSRRLSIPFGGSAVANFEPPPPHLSGSAPIVLKAQQAQLRREGEKTASAELDEARSGRQRAELENIELKAQLSIEKARSQQFMEEAESFRRESSDERRARLEIEESLLSMEERLEEVMALAEILRADNEFSPPELRLMVLCCRELSNDCTVDAVAEKGIGLREQVRRWLEKRAEKPAEIQIDRFATALTLLSRKKGGAPTRNSRKKG